MMNSFSLWTPTPFFVHILPDAQRIQTLHNAIGSLYQSIWWNENKHQSWNSDQNARRKCWRQGQRTFSRRKKNQSDLMTKITRIWGRRKAGTRISTTYCFFVMSGRRLLEVMLDSVKTFWGEEWALEYNGQSIAFSIVLPLHIVQRAILNIFSV